MGEAVIIGLVGVSGAGKDTAGAVIAQVLNGKCVAFADPLKRWCMNVLKLTEQQLWGDEKEKPIAELPPPLSASKSTAPPWVDALVRACGDHIGYSRAHPDMANSTLEQALRQWWRSLSSEGRLTPRRVMQHFGTEFVRNNLGADYWVDAGLSIADKLLLNHDYDRLQGLARMHGGRDAVVFTDVRFRNEALAIRRRGGLLYRIEREGGSRTKLADHASEVEQSTIPQFWLDGTLLNRFDTPEEFQAAVRHVALERIVSRGGAVN